MPRMLFAVMASTCMLVSACNDQSSPIESTLSERADLRTAQNPDGPGAVVGRGEGGLFFIFPDPAVGLIVTAGFTLENLAAFCARQPFVTEPSTIGGVLRPDSSATDLTTAKKVTLLVFLDDNQDVCDNLSPMAAGKGNYVNNDNDLFVSGNRTNSFGFRVVGQVTDVNGERHRLSVSFHGLIYRDGELRITRTGINLH